MRFCRPFSSSRYCNVIALFTLNVFLVLYSVQGEFQNHYEVLGIDSKATEKDIKRAYRKMTLLYHPDKQADKSKEEQEKAKQLFHKITKANEVLSDKKLRAQFDEDLEFGLGDESYYGGGAYSNIFEQERMERRRQRERNRRYGFFGKMDSITSYIYPFLFIYGLYNAMSNGGFNLSSFGDLPRYFGFDPNASSASNGSGDHVKNRPYIGIDVIIHNISKQPDFNGKQGKILSYNPEKQRYIVQFGNDGEKRVALKPKNLKPLYILIDHFYMIDNLQNASQYNGHKCKIVSLNNTTKRYNVEFKYNNELKQLAIKQENIIMCIPGSDEL